MLESPPSTRVTTLTHGILSIEESMGPIIPSRSSTDCTPVMIKSYSVPTASAKREAAALLPSVSAPMSLMALSAPFAMAVKRALSTSSPSSAIAVTSEACPASFRLTASSSACSSYSLSRNLMYSVSRALPLSSTSSSSAKSGTCFNKTAIFIITSLIFFKKILYVFSRTI